MDSDRAEDDGRATRGGPIREGPRLRVLLGQAIAIGPGKADLLAAIEREGSITRAAKAMGMSYRRAWLLVETMNACFTAPLVAAVAAEVSMDRGLGRRETVKLWHATFIRMRQPQSGSGVLRAPYRPLPKTSRRMTATPRASRGMTQPAAHPGARQTV